MREETDTPAEAEVCALPCLQFLKAEGLWSPSMGLLQVGDGVIKVSVGFCIVLSRG